LKEREFTDAQEKLKKPQMVWRVWSHSKGPGENPESLETLQIIWRNSRDPEDTPWSQETLPRA
jgi:hypothetical protein